MASDETARAYARTFAGPHGEAVLAHLRAATIGRRLGPEASEAFRPVDPALVAAIEALIVRGRG
ncbi:MAG: hypothetical protein ACK4QW_15565 [Alphaproteobacteria bacterium]